MRWLPALGSGVLAALVLAGCTGGPPAGGESDQALILARRMEVKSELQSLALAEKAFFAENSAYSALFDDLGAGLAPRNWAYFLPGNSLQPPNLNFALPPETSPRADTDGFLIVAVGNLDSDPALDVWTIDQSNNIVNAIDDLAK
jgi:hypothetical protein